jgi:hypothetical protein
MKKLSFLLLLLSSLLVLSLGAFAQVQNGQFAGTVNDPSGAAIAGASVTVINLGTNLTVSTNSNDTGSYTVKELPVGNYRIRVEAKGFKTSTNTNVSLNAGTIARVDFTMELGQTREVVEVTGEGAAVNTEDSKLSSTVTSTQIANLPLNGRNVYDLMQQAPGAVNVNGTDFEFGHGTVVNGLREDFNGFLINGVSNKDLSGGVINTPIQDTVQEFQQLELNVSAQYGSSAGSINNLVTKSGTNSFHGSIWEYARNSAFDANYYFINQQGAPRNPLHFNQFGGTIGGPIIKDKLFFFGSYQGDRFITTLPPTPVTVESPEWRQAVVAASNVAGSPTANSTAALLYKDFAPGIAGQTSKTLDQWLGGGVSANSSQPTGHTYGDYLCPDFVGQATALKFQYLMGVTPADQAAMAAGLHSTSAPCSAIPAVQTGAISRNIPFQNTTVALSGSQIQSIGNLFQGNEGSGRLDYNWNSNNRVFLQFNWLKQNDQFGPCTSACARGFSNPTRNIFPSGQFSYVRVFSPTVLNEFKLGYAQNNIGTSVSLPGVPDILFDDTSMGFGSYNGYPQFFKDHEYSYGDMVSISHGKHNFKIGADLKRNIENSEFDIARGSYYFFDPLFFTADAPYAQASGVNPGFTTNSPAALGDNVRHWRNWEVGAYVQDDWKVTKRLTLNLGLRWDLFTRHTEEDNLATTFILGTGATLPQQLKNANAPFNSDPTLSTCNPNTVPVTNSQVLAGVCGQGGFAKTNQLGPNQYKDFGPRVGFAYDVFGNGKTSLRGGFGISYEGTLYNPLSNSRWNPPFYSFGTGTNAVGNFPNGPIGGVIWGPTTCPTPTTCAPSGAVPTFTGPPTNPGQGVGAQATGNINGWNADNPLIAKLTGIVLPQGIRDPYVYNDFLSIQSEILPKLVLEVNYVATSGHRLFRAENINRQTGGKLPSTACGTNNIGEKFCGLLTATNNSGRANPNYGTMRDWQNAVNSNYNSLQVSLKKQASQGLLFNVSYTYSHSIDDGSTWHSGGTTATGASGGDGYTTDIFNPSLDRGNSVFDIRQRLSLNYVWDLPGQNLHGLMGVIAGGWGLNGIISWQTGPHWSPFNGSSARVTCTDPTNIATCTNGGGDYNLDTVANDRPNSTIAGLSGESRSQWAKGLGSSFVNSTFSAPCLGCVGSLGRNTFVGPDFFGTDMTLGKRFKLTERVRLKFEAQAFNIFNRPNFILATSGGAGHNKITDASFGQAGGTLDPRELQLGLKLSF